MKKLTVIFMGLMASFMAFGQPVFNKVLDHNNRAEVGRPLLEFEAGKYLYGYSSIGPGAKKMIFESTDSSGFVLKSAVLIEQGKSITMENLISTNNGHAMACFAYDSTGDGNLGILLLNENLQKKWYKEFNVGYGHEGATAINQTSRGEFLLIGFSNAFPDEDYQGVLIKTDTSGNELWRKIYGDSTKWEDCHDVMPLPNGDIIMLCNRKESNQDQDVWVIRTDSMGNIKWDYTYDSPGYARGEQMELSPDGEHIFIAGGKRLSIYNRVGFLLKINTAGNKIWEKNYKINDNGWFTGLDMDANDDLIIGGVDDASYHNSLEGYMVKVDQNGNVIWEYLYNPLGKEQQVNEYFYNVIAVSDGGYLAAGFTSKGEESGSQDGWIFKVDSMGQVDTATAYPWVAVPKVTQAGASVHLSPNPFTTTCKVQVTAPGMGPLDWHLQNMHGQTVDKGTMGQAGIRHQTTLQRKNLPPGIYWLTFTNNSGAAVGNAKVVVQ